ncbi:hypothetical protein BH09ACT3_BH09ACT3_08300 [soil metagenome]
MHWGPNEARSQIVVPGPDDDKYSRGVLGVITGSAMYPGAAVLGVEAALRTGVGMVRFLGAERPSELVLARRPEVVTMDGRVQAWLMGSGMDASSRDAATADLLDSAIATGRPTVLDAGALDLLPRLTGPVVITPHAGELARVLGVQRAEIVADPAGAAERAAAHLGVTVLLKGHRTHVAGPGGPLLVAATAPSWLATAGAGDALAGVLGALVATHAESISRRGPELAELAATAVVIHGLAAEQASAGGPFVVLDLAASVSVVIARLLAG